MKDELGAFHGVDHEDGGRDQSQRNSSNLTWRRNNNADNTQLKHKDLPIMNEKEKFVRRSNNHAGPNELILSPNAYQQQVDLPGDGSSSRGQRKAVQDVRRATYDTVFSL